MLGGVSQAARLAILKRFDRSGLTILLAGVDKPLDPRDWRIPPTP